jgi:hypothetical protein
MLNKEFEGTHSLGAFYLKVINSFCRNEIEKRDENMNENWIIPILASAFTILFTTVITIAKEIWQEKRKTSRELRNEKLINLYNKLYVLKIKYYDKLDLSDIFNRDAVVIDKPNFSTWEHAIKDVQNVLDEKIHLLEASDLTLWETFLECEAAEYYLEEAFFPKYQDFIIFLKETSVTYKNLYKDFHGK